ncbi:MAG: trigger factor [Acidocella sp. 20-57-95]|nr:MAG: trigger factor [Acidocella sp. 20-57-95]OYV61049.1 MAG: trigger factor [Acidocella sp. 21-58-7]HQT65095.1 trigger factor [Acidocella sp.]HQU04112.1 trigger factor [Acidocella sp.]
MQVTETLTDGLKRGFTVVVPEPELAVKREKRLAELGRTMQVPGFRPGKVPMSLVRKRYGSAVAAEVAEGAINAASDQLLAERNLRPAMQPKLEVTKHGENSDLEFTVEMEILPDITIPGLGDIVLKKPVATVTDEAVADALAKLADQRKTFEKVEEIRPAVAGEQLTVDFIGRIDGVAFEGGSATDVPIIIAGPGFIPGFSEQMEGMTAAETRTITVPFPEDYGAKDLAGKTAAFEITGKSLAVPKVAEIDDEFAKTLGMESLADLQKTISEQISREYQTLTRLKLKRSLLDALSDKAVFEAPQGLVDAEFNEIWRQVEAEKAAGRADPEDAEKDEATLRAEYRGIADRRVRLGLLVAEIGRANNIVVSDQDLQRAMFNEAMKYRDQAMQVLEFFKKNPRELERFRGPIFEDKVVDYLLGTLTLEEVSVTPEELAADPEV